MADHKNIYGPHSGQDALVETEFRNLFPNYVSQPSPVIPRADTDGPIFEGLLLTGYGWICKQDTGNESVYIRTAEYLKKLLTLLFESYF